MTLRIDHLAQARNTISVNPEVAWELINRFRAGRGLRALREPWSPLSHRFEYAPEKLP